MVAIVNVVVSQQVAPLPSKLQQTGALISWGGTATAPGTASLLTLPADLTPLLFVPKALTSLTWLAGIVTATAVAASTNLTIGDTLLVTISGAVPVAYNGTFLATVTGAKTFTYQLPINPGAETSPGTWQTGSLAEIQQMVNTFFGQGAFRSVYILELGPLGPTKAVAALTSYITATPHFFYSYLVPRCWDANAAYLAFLPTFESPTSMTYFHTTMTLETYGQYNQQMKCVLPYIEAPVYGTWSANALTSVAYVPTVSDAVESATYTAASGVMALTFAAAPFGASVGSTLNGTEVRISGIAGGITAIASATYTSGTGILALTFAAAPFGAAVGATLNGAEIEVGGITGGSVNGTWPITSTGTSGTVINVQLATGLGALTLDTTLGVMTTAAAIVNGIWPIVSTASAGTIINVQLPSILTASALVTTDGVMATTVGTVTAATTSAHGVAVGQWFQISGCLPAGYNGWFQAQYGTAGSTLIYDVLASLGAETELGELVPSYASSSGIPNTEFSAASGFWKTLSYAPSSTNKVTPLNYSFVYGVTQFPTFGNSALLQTLKDASVNIIQTGALGGITNTILTWGTTLDGNKFNYWYATDWMQIQLALNLSNAIINGSNNPVNPLYYNQQGINTLENVIAVTANNGVTFGLVLFTATQLGLDGPLLDMNLDNGLYVGFTVVNAVPFITYSNENPGDYAIGRYNGFSCIFTPQNGFDEIQVNLVVTDFVSNV